MTPSHVDFDVISGPSLPRGTRLTPPAPRLPPKPKPANVPAEASKAETS